jgi:hypothetical protein
VKKMYGLTHETTDPDVPLYGIICRTGKEWTVRLKEKHTPTGCTINGNISGYGDFPFERFPELPVIDFSGESFDRCFEALRVMDHIKVKSGKETVERFINEYLKMGFKIKTFYPRSKEVSLVVL